MTELSHFERVKLLIAATISNCEKRIQLLEILPTPEEGQYIAPLVPLIRENIEKLNTYEAQNKLLRSSPRSSYSGFVEESLNVLSDLANQIDAFDAALKRSKWGRTQLKRIKKRDQ
jgi:hypothetical protein